MKRLNTADTELTFRLFDSGVDLSHDQRCNAGFLTEIIVAGQVLNLIVLKGSLEKRSVEIIVAALTHYLSEPPFFDRLSPASTNRLR